MKEEEGRNKTGPGLEGKISPHRLELFRFFCNMAIKALTGENLDSNENENINRKK